MPAGRRRGRRRCCRAARPARATPDETPPRATAHERAGPDHRQPAARPRGRVRLAADPDARTSTRWPRAGIHFTRAFPEAMVTVPARRSIFGSRRIFPFRNWKPNPELGTSPGLAADRRRRSRRSPASPEATTATGPRRCRTTRSSAFMGAVRAVPQDVRPLGDDRGPVRLPAGPRERADVDRGPLAPAVPARRALHARHAQVPRQHGRGRATRSETCAARVFKGAMRPARRRAPLRQPFAFVVDCFDPHEPWSTPKKYLDMYGDPGYKGQEVGVTPLRLRAQLHARAAAPRARRLRRRGHDDGPLARPLHGPLLRARAARRTRSSCCCRTTATCWASAATPARCPRSSTPSWRRCRS